MIKISSRLKEFSLGDKNKKKKQQLKRFTGINPKTGFVLIHWKFRKITRGRLHRSQKRWIWINKLFKLLLFFESHSCLQIFPDVLCVLKKEINSIEIHVWVDSHAWYNLALWILCCCNHYIARCNSENLIF